MQKHPVKFLNEEKEQRHLNVMNSSKTAIKSGTTLFIGTVSRCELFLFNLGHGRGDLAT